MGFISLFFIITFTLLYVGRGMDNPPEFIAKCVQKIEDNIDNVAFWGLLYGIAAVLLLGLARAQGFELVVRLLTNIMIALLALPLTLDHLLEKYKEKVPEAMANELRSIGAAVTKREKVFGYIGAGLSIVLFALLFR